MTRMLCATAVLLAAAAVSAQAQGTRPTPTPSQQQTPPLLPTTPKPTPSATPAPQVPFPADSKIAVVNIQIVVNESKLGQASTAQLKALTDKQQADLAQKNNAVRALQQQIQAQSSVVTPAALQQLNSELERQQRDLQYAQSEAQAQAEEMNQKLLADFQEKVLPVIDELAKEKGLYVVFSMQEAGIAYVHPGLDLSAEVTKRLDVKYPGK